MLTACGPPQRLPLPQCAEEILCEPLRFDVDGTPPFSYGEPSCVLQALRDRTPGRLQIEWGHFMSDGPTTSVTIWIIGDDTVLMHWVVYISCCGYHTEYVSRRVLLQPAAYFDDCLTTPDFDHTIACFLDGITLDDLTPPGWLPPWTIGKCDDTLAPTCE